MGSQTVSSPAVPETTAVTQAAHLDTGTRVEALYLATRYLDIHPYFGPGPDPALVEAWIAAVLIRFGGPAGVAAEYAAVYGEHYANSCVFEVRRALRWCRHYAVRAGGRIGA